MNSDLDKLVRQEFGLGRAESPLRVYHLKDPRLPQFEFEWHVGAQKVYRIDCPGAWIDGEFVCSSLKATGYCIAEHCLTHAQFIAFVQTFCRGYLVAVRDRNAGTLNTHAPERIVSKETDPCPTR